MFALDWLNAYFYHKQRTYKNLLVAIFLFLAALVDIWFM